VSIGDNQVVHDTWSAASDPEDDDGSDDGDDSADDGDDGGDNGADDDNDGEDASNPGKTRKRAAGAQTLEHYARSNTELLHQNDEDNRPGSLTSASHVSSDHARHKFMAVTERLMNEENLPRSEALSESRRRYPDIFRSWQLHIAGNGSVSKSASDLVAAEMARCGVTEEIAKQRIVNLYGAAGVDALRDTRMAKADDAEQSLVERASEIMDAEGGDRVSALRKARLLNPSLYRRLA
jgi:hypothetical protein